MPSPKINIGLSEILCKLYDALQTLEKAYEDLTIYRHNNRRTLTKATDRNNEVIATGCAEKRRSLIIFDPEEAKYFVRLIGDDASGEYRTNSVGDATKMMRFFLQA